MNGGRDRISPQYNGSNSSRPASTSTYDIKSDSPSRKRRRVSTRQSPTSSWENRQSPRSSQNHGHQHSPLLRRRLREQPQRSWEQLPNIFQQTPSPPHQQQQRKINYIFKWYGFIFRFLKNCFKYLAFISLFVICNFQVLDFVHIKFIYSKSHNYAYSVDFEIQKRHNSSKHSKIHCWLK